MWNVKEYWKLEKWSQNCKEDSGWLQCCSDSQFEVPCCSLYLSREKLGKKKKSSLSSYEIQSVITWWISLSIVLKFQCILIILFGLKEVATCQFLGNWWCTCSIKKVSGCIEINHFIANKKVLIVYYKKECREFEVCR